MDFDSVLKHSQAYNFWKWASRRNRPEEGRIFLSQRRVYILPTRQGLLFAAALLVMLIGSINYNLSLGYVLTFLLAGMAVISILHTFRNLAYLAITPGRAQAVFAGGTAHFGLNFENARDEPRRAIRLLCEGEAVRTGISGGRTETVCVPVRAARRGSLMLPRVTLDTVYPLGLFRAWSYIQPDMRVLVYPRPDDASLPEAFSPDDAGDAANAGAGSDDFAGLRGYQQDDSPRHVAWKAVATHDVLLTKTFIGRASRRLVFDWNDLGDLEVEARLSRLARYVLLANEGGLGYGLRIPGRDIPIAAGEEQMKTCLEALALHGDRGR